MFFLPISQKKRAIRSYHTVSLCICKAFAPIITTNSFLGVRWMDVSHPFHLFFTPAHPKIWNFHSARLSPDCESETSCQRNAPPVSAWGEDRFDSQSDSLMHGHGRDCKDRDEQQTSVGSGTRRMERGR